MKSHLFLAAFCSLCLTTFTQGQFQFSDLIGSETVRAEQVKLTATKNNANDNAVKLKTKDEEKVTIAAKRLTPSFTSSRRGLTLLDLFASEQPRALDEPETSPSREALGFGTKPMSFMTNFKRDLPFDGTKKIRVKRSRLPPFDLDVAASAQRGGIDPAIVAAMFQRQLELAEEHGLPTHEAVPFRVSAPSSPAALPVGAPAPHQVKTMHLPHHHSVSIATPDHHVSHGVDFGLNSHHPRVHHQHVQVHHVEHPHQPHHAVPKSEKLIRAPVHHAVHHAPAHHAPAHHAPAHHAVHHAPAHHPIPVKSKGYPPPHNGGTLEEIFHLGANYAAPPVPDYTPPDPAYHPPALPPSPAYHEPAPAEAYHPPAALVHKGQDFHGHPFSMEMIFGLPMHGYYMKKYAPTLPFHHLEDKYHPAPKHPEPAYKEPEPAYHPAPVAPAHHVAAHHPHHHPTPVYNEPAPVYHPAPTPVYKEPEYHPPPTPAYKEPEYHPAPAYKEPEPLYHPTPTPVYKEPEYHPPPTPVYKEPEYHPTPIPAYKEPEYHPAPAYKEPEPVYHPAPTPVYHPAPISVVAAAYKEPLVVHHDPTKHYLPPKSHGGTLEDVFGISSKYAHPAPHPVPIHPAPPGAAYKEPPAHHPVVHHSNPAYVEPPPAYHNSYSLHYLPYEDYQPHHAESIALKSRVPTLPAAHLLVQAPHPHLRPHHPHVSVDPRPHHPVPHHVSKRSAQDQKS